MSDIEKSFAYLHDNIPPWLKTLSEIESKIAIMQNEIAKVPVSPLKRKTGSVESIRDLDDIVQDPDRSAPQQTSPARPGNPNPQPVDSGTPSASFKVRSKAMMIIVHYDGQIQKDFEQLVRNIGTGRNLLRKGKMAARAEALAELASSDSDSEGSDNEDVDNIRSKIQFRRRAGLSSMRSRPTTRAGANPSSSTSTPEALFDSTDKALEQAQSLCERAAHQSLREGDCRKELDSVRKHFQDILDSARTEVAKHKARREKEAERKASMEAKRTSTNSTSSQAEAEIKPILPVKPPPPPVTTKSMEIEIDDEDEDDDLDIVMPPIRLTSRA
jgi:hypothetical protein